MKRYASLLAVFGLAAAPAAIAAGSTLSDILGNSEIAASGYIDASYDYLNSDGVFTSGVPSRVFDGTDAFIFHQAAGTLAYLPSEGFGGLVNLTLGHDASLIHSLGGDTGNFDATQAYLQYATGNWTVIGGKFVTASGAEVINSTTNFNASRSILFGYAIPFTHTGARATYKFSDALNVYAGVNNGWDQLSDANRQKTAELGAAFTPNKTFNLLAVAYSGSEPGLTDASGNVPTGNRTLVDVVATLNVTEALSFMINGDYAHQKNAISQGVGARWDGVAGYANYKVNDRWRTSLRFEYFNDKDGYRTGVAQKWKEGTATLVYSPAPSFDLLGEVRDDFSNKHSFVRDSSPHKSETSVILKAIFKFSTPTT